MTENDGGPAFPSEQGTDPHGCWNQTYAQGMSLRDYIAVKVLLGLMLRYKDAGYSDSYAIAESYSIADDMLKVREL